MMSDSLVDISSNVNSYVSTYGDDMNLMARLKLHSDNPKPLMI